MRTITNSPLASMPSSGNDLTRASRQLRRPSSGGESRSGRCAERRATRIALLLAAVETLSCAATDSFATTRPADAKVESIYVKTIPPRYRDWRLISVAHEEGTLDDLRAVLGNDVAIQAYRDGKLPFPEGTIIARLAWRHDASEENNKVFGRSQSFVAGPPKNGVQFMVKDSKQYAATGGWGFGHFDDGNPADDAVLSTCFPCHAATTRDLVFTHYAR